MKRLVYRDVVAGLAGHPFCDMFVTLGIQVFQMKKLRTPLRRAGFIQPEPANPTPAISTSRTNIYNNVSMPKRLSGTKIRRSALHLLPIIIIIKYIILNRTNASLNLLLSERFSNTIQKFVSLAKKVALQIRYQIVPFMTLCAVVRKAGACRGRTGSVKLSTRQRTGGSSSLKS
jgi:hypothetical protein